MALRGPAGVLYDLVVDPAHRRQGIGTALLEAALTWKRRIADYGLRRTPQMNADRLLISAASAISQAGFRTSMTGDPEQSAASLFPICPSDAIGKCLF
jgi:GNAT superfamily N-acetyltransferase